MIRDSVAALHYLLHAKKGKEIHSHVLQTCHKIFGKWEGETARGLSSHITDCMILDLLEKEDRKEYKAIVQGLKEVSNG